MAYMLAVEPRGLRRGLCLFWKDMQQVVLCKYADFFIEAVIKADVSGALWRLFAIYASTDDRIRRSQWQALQDRVHRSNDACLLIRDFNDILDETEKLGGLSRSERSMQDFRSFVANTHLLDLGYVGQPFTWRNRRQDVAICERLDRGLATDQWVATFSGVTLHHLAVVGSDHLMLMLHTQVPPSKWRKRFIYDPRWGEAEGCPGVVQHRWARQFTGPRGVQVTKKLRWVRRGLLDWRRSEWWSSKASIELLRKDLCQAYFAPDLHCEMIRHMENKLKEALHDEEVYWKLKSRVHWLNEGDKNLKFFHSKMVTRRRANRILGLEDTHRHWCDGPSDIHKIAVAYFEDIFTSCNPTNIVEITGCVHRKVTAQHNEVLLHEVTTEEIWSAVQSLHPTKSPGPDGYTGSFFHQFWDVNGPDINGLVKSFFHSGRLHKKLNHTHIVLIPKVGNPRKMTQWRPIALCNLVYKIISKILTLRLEKVLPAVVSINQSAFVEDRLITDNILIVHEILHSLKSESRVGGSGLALKLDMAKAYDWVEWIFLDAMMRQLGFDPTFCQWILECLSTVTYSILLNGEASRPMSPSRGLRQGDPLSPFLFLICAEGLSALLHRHEERGSLHGFKLRPQGLSISHLFFADDSAILCHTEEREVYCLKQILDCYAKGSDQCINFDKSSIFFGKKCPARLKGQLAHILGVRHSGDFGKYLGLNADFGVSKRGVFEMVRKRIASKLMGWAEQYLSSAGKEVLIKAVAMAMPNYSMSCFKLPVSLCKEIERDIANFWWKGHKDRRGIHWVSWQKLCQFKKAGGMGFRDLLCFNLAMLTKIGWRILRNPNSLLARLLQEKYYVQSDFMHVVCGRKVSWGWKGILQGRRILEAGLRWRIGNGENVCIQQDRWLPTPSPSMVHSQHPDMPLMVHELIDQNMRCWDMDLVNRCFNPNEAKCISTIPISRWGCPDKKVWHYTSHGGYTVRSGYAVALTLRRNGELGRKAEGESSQGDKQRRIWKSIWGLQVPPKIRTFLWKCCRNVLAVKENLLHWGIDVETTCALCGQEGESQVHVFFKCEFARLLWFASPIQLDPCHILGKDFIVCWENLLKKYEQGTVIEPHVAVECFLNQVHEFRTAQMHGKPLINELPRPPEIQAETVTSWRKLPYGVLKVNCDAAWVSQTQMGGVGWVVRDSYGWMVQDGCKGDMRGGSALAMEAKAIREALLACVQSGLSKLEWKPLYLT
ncbi:unnamed protein product [Prunus armeniaca]|uniref:Reverse transcriptase domain-containing protein n=1 Tax=Prunus armeniaca TaxID=36596 RepID=A0A6J5X8F1_PRUAR|nr:unnamed protein product [Prunus armeniaca]